MAAGPSITAVSHAPTSVTLVGWAGKDAGDRPRDTRPSEEANCSGGSTEAESFTRAAVEAPKGGCMCRGRKAECLGAQALPRDHLPLH